MSKELTKRERLANDYATKIMPDFSDYHNWKLIKEAYLAGWDELRSVQEVVYREMGYDSNK